MSRNLVNWAKLYVERWSFKRCTLLFLTAKCKVISTVRDACLYSHLLGVGVLLFLLTGLVSFVESLSFNAKIKDSSLAAHNDWGGHAKYTFRRAAY